MTNPKATSDHADALVPILAAALVAMEGYPCPQNQTLSRMTGLTVSQIDYALARGIATGRLRRDMQKRARRLVVLDPFGAQVGATGYSRCGGGPIPDIVIKRIEAAVSGAGGAPKPRAPRPRTEVDPEAVRVVRDRCPMCDMPPDHAECRHGWDGVSTRAMRRDMAMLVAGTLGRAA